MARLRMIRPARLRALDAARLAGRAGRLVRAGDRPAAIRALIDLDRFETDRSPAVALLARALIVLVERRLGLPHVGPLELAR